MKSGNETFNPWRWISVALINFCLVALAGVVLRYKINFPLPSVNQKNLLHGHSHFAFVGWVTIILMALMVHYIQIKRPQQKLTKYNLILFLNCLSAYGMFAGFIAKGYDTISILFTCICILVSYIFIVIFWRDLKGIKDESFAPQWLKASLILWALSSFGAIALAYLMIYRIMIQDFYFGAIYFFLHFQYNGWFLFACFALLFSALNRNGISLTNSLSKNLFFVMAITVIPTYLLSIIWLKLPPLLLWIGNVSGILQLLVLVYFIRLFPLLKRNGFLLFSKSTRWLWVMASIAFIIKIILQLLSIIPFLSHYAFGYRPVIIGYLHLSFLGIISFFILGYIDFILKYSKRALSKIGLILFIAGVLLQQCILMLQGLEALEFKPVKLANIALFYCALLIFTGLVILVIQIIRKKPTVPSLVQ
ncbi:MAG: hypothetical protein ABIN48_08485 [Ginsengibacter sp.]